MISDSVDTSSVDTSNDAYRCPSCWLDPLAYFGVHACRIPLIGLGLSIAGKDSVDEDELAAT
jgi:hypothetical protein